MIDLTELARPAETLRFATGKLHPSNPCCNAITYLGPFFSLTPPTLYLSATSFFGSCTSSHPKFASTAAAQWRHPENRAENRFHGLLTHAGILTDGDHVRPLIATVATVLDHHFAVFRPLARAAVSPIPTVLDHALLSELIVVTIAAMTATPPAQPIGARRLQESESLRSSLQSHRALTHASRHPALYPTATTIALGINLLCLTRLQA